MADVVYDLNVVPPGANGRRLMTVDPEAGTVVITGPDDCPPFLCGKCGAELIVGVRPENVANAVGDVLLRCNACTSINESPPPR
jgi:hypothetical protein